MKNEKRKKKKKKKKKNSGYSRLCDCFLFGTVVENVRGMEVSLVGTRKRKKMEKVVANSCSFSIGMNENKKMSQALQLKKKSK